MSTNSFSSAQNQLFEEPDFQTFVPDPIEEDTYYYSENSSCVANYLSEFRQTIE